MNSLKDLYLLLEEENLTSPTHHTDRRAPAEEQPPSPTIKVGWSDMPRSAILAQNEPGQPVCLRRLPAVQRRQQHPGGPEGGAAGPERRTTAGKARLSGAHPAVCQGQGVVGSGEDRAAESHHAGRERQEKHHLKIQSTEG